MRRNLDKKVTIITDITKIDRTAWAQFVQQSPTATWFQTPEAYNFYISVPQQLRVFGVAVCEGTALRGIVVGFIPKDSNPLIRYFARRAIIYGGPLLAEDISEEELSALLKALTDVLRRKAIYIETRNFCSLSAWEHVFEACGFAYVPHYDMHIDCANRETMIRLIHDSKMRQIRKAEKDGVRIVEASTAQEVHDYFVLLSRLYRQKVHRPLFGEEFFQRFVADKRGVLLLAKQAEQVVGGVLCPVLEGKVLYEWYIVGPAIVTWAGMDYANRNELPIFDLMGGGTPDMAYGVRDFKQQFGSYIKKFGRYLHINNHFLYTLGTFGVKNILR